MDEIVPIWKRYLWFSTWNGFYNMYLVFSFFPLNRFLKNRFQDLISHKLRINIVTPSIFGEFLKIIESTLVYIWETKCVHSFVLSVISIHAVLPTFESQLQIRIEMDIADETCIRKTFMKSCALKRYDWPEM